MSCCNGLNAYVGLVVPPTNIDGPLTATTNLAAEKTIYLTGTFNGDYVILGSHDNVNFVPVAKFTGNGNPQSAKLRVDATLASMRVRRNADAAAVISIGTQQTCDCPPEEPTPPQLANDSGGAKAKAKAKVSAKASPGESLADGSQIAAHPNRPRASRPGSKGSVYPKARAAATKGAAKAQKVSKK